MQHCIIYNKFNLSWVFSLLMLITAAAMAGSNKADSNNSQYSLQLTGGQSNPWALPQAPDSHSGYRQLPKYYNQDDRQQRQNQKKQNKVWRNPGERFVTPEFLESLKQQQRQNQLMPGDRRYQQRPSPQSRWQQPLQGNYSYPSYGMGHANPLYDAPAVSPWGGGADVLYRGESFPMVPSEAIGGIPPLYTPSIGGGSYGNSPWGESNNADENNTGINGIEKRNQNRVFNPFSFLTDGGYK